MSKLRPVKLSYSPGYPRRLSDEELRAFLHPALRRRFSKEVMLLSTVLIGSTLSSCARNLPNEELPGAAPGATLRARAAQGVRKTLPGMGKSTRTDPQLREKVDQLVDEVMSPMKKGGWYENSTIAYTRLIAANPVSKVPSVRISFGNSISGIFDVKEAAKVTSALFEAYGIPLKSNVSVAGNGYDFVADGYNEELGVGFEIRGENGRSPWWSSQEEEELEGAAFLSDGELAPLEKDVLAGRRDIFVSDPYTIYDEDHVMAMSYYLASVVDYLNWIHGDREIDYSEILGDQRKVAEHFRPRYTEQTVYWNAEGDNFSEGWTIDHGEVSTIGVGLASRIRLDLAPGGTATFSVPVGASLQDSPRLYGTILWTVSSLTPADVPVDVDFQLNGIPKSRTRVTRMPGEGNDLEMGGFNYPDDAPMFFSQMSVTNVNGFKVELEVSRVSARHY